MRDIDIAAALYRLTGRVVSENAVKLVRNKMGVKKRQGRGVCELRPDISWNLPGSGTTP